MASPVLETFCCMPFLNYTTCVTNESEVSNHTRNDLSYSRVHITYNALVITSSALSIFGAVFQLIPKAPRNQISGSRQLESMLRQNTIICCLAIADLLATIGILVRSALWLEGFLPSLDEFVPRLFCAVSSAWVQYFYVCTYFWTFIYAVDILRLTQKKPCRMPLYHIVCWGLPAALSLGGLVPLYHDTMTDCTSSYRLLIPHYLTSYIPICLVMIANPILYYKTLAIVKQHFYNSAVYSRSERAFVDAANKRFRSFTAVFYVCWLPNVINGLLIPWSSNLPPTLDLVMWHLIAVLNPLQAFLNSIVYRGVGLCYQRLYARKDVDSEDDIFSRHAEDTSPSSYAATNSDETSPLLRSFSRS